MENAQHRMTAFCLTCPDEKEVAQVLRGLGFQLVLSMPAEEKNEFLCLPALPAQYHYEDEVGTRVEYLAGIDTPCLADDEDDPEERTTYRYPPHASRFWLAPGGYELVARRVRDTLTAKWNVRWLDLCEGQPIEEAA